MQQKNNIVIAFDIGSSKICAIIAEIFNKDELKILGISTNPSSGMEKGKIIDEDAFYKAIEKTAQKAEQKALVKPSFAICNFPMYRTQVYSNTVIIKSKEISGIIGKNDLIELRKKAALIQTEPNLKIMHLFPIEFKIDDKKVNDPVGTKGEKLQSENTLIFSDEKNISIVQKTIEKLNYPLIDFIYDGLAIGQIMLNDEKPNENMLILEIGGRFSKILRYLNGVLYDGKIIPIGGDTITSDIAYCLKVSLPEAERLKHIYGDTFENLKKADQKIEIITKNEGRKEIPLTLLTQIISARVKELVTFLEKDISDNKTQAKKIIVCGCGSLLRNLNNYIEQRLQVPVQSGIPTAVENSIPGLSYVTCLGLVFYCVKNSKLPLVESVQSNSISKFINKVFESLKM